MVVNLQDGKLKRIVSISDGQLLFQKQVYRISLKSKPAYKALTCFSQVQHCQVPFSFYMPTPQICPLQVSRVPCSQHFKSEKGIEISCLNMTWQKELLLNRDKAGSIAQTLEI